jgi:hypothetical protein
MTTVLVLSHDLDMAKDWLLRQNVASLYIIDERQLLESNPPKFGKGFDDINYSREMVETLRIKQFAFKSQRPLVILMDMRHQTAVNNIAHDMSILVYDVARGRRIAYNPTYKTTHIIEDFESVVLADLLQKCG